MYNVFSYFFFFLITVYFISYIIEKGNYHCFYYFQDIAGIGLILNVVNEKVINRIDIIRYNNFMLVF